MKPEANKFEELIEKYRYWIGGILILAIVCGSAVLIWRENYQKSSYDDRIRNLESRISQLQADKEQDTRNNNQTNSNTHILNNQPESQGQVAGTSATSSQKQETSNEKQITGKVNINTANTSELDALPGIGPTYAQRIIDYRNANGPFKSIEELDNVKGIGPATIEKLRDQATI